jgi:calcineurin-like phosphoesterase family protein
MSEIWYVSDLHIDHRFVAAERGFDSTAEHDRVLAENWDSRVARDDIVEVLGDISVGGKRAELNALQWVSRRPGRKHLKAGNHDGCHAMRSEAAKWQRIYLDTAFESVQQYGIRKIADQRVLLCHFPFQGSDYGDHTPENRFEEWRLPCIGENADRWLLHGHTHSPIKVRGRQLHIGLDAHDLTPVPQTWVQHMIANDPPF